MSLVTVFQNESLILLDKPAGWLTTPARSADDPRPCLGRELQTQIGKQVYPVHRLDFEVSGLVMFALTTSAHILSQKWFEDRAVGKTYHAVATASASPGEWVEWKSKIVRGKKRSFEAAHGLDSITRARVIRADARGSWWELLPITGRPHQLRFEMAKHGFPIAGDTLYGGTPIPGRENFIALRAVALDFGGVAERLGLPESIRVEDLQLA